MDKKNFRWWDLPSAILLIIVLEVVAFRLRITGWTPNLVIVEALVFASTILGLALGYSTFRAWIVWIFGLVFTLFFIPLEFGWLMESFNPEWWDKLNDLYARLYFSVFDFIHNKPVQDPLLFLTVMAIFFWMVGILAGYQLTRHGKPWGPLIISGLGLLIIDFYTPYIENRDRYSAIFVFLTLFLIARNYLLRSRREWAEKGATVDPEIGFNMGRTVAISGLVLILVAWNIPLLVQALTPSTEIQKSLAQQWEILREKLQNGVAGLTSPAVATSDYFGNSLALGAGGARDEEIVFTVKISGDIPTGIRFYWKAHSYDQYNGSWISVIDSTQSINANKWPFLYPDWQGRKVVDFTFSAATASIRNLYLPAFPLSIGHGADVIGKVEPDGTFDLVGLMANPILKSGETFQARSWVTAPTIFQLQNASKKFTSNVTNTYLQLPDGFSPRVKNLAVDITRNLSTQYDKVEAVTNWLRKNITYKETVAPPPEGVDPIVWFLFDYKKGFCNYYASAEVLMLRSLGIPARLAVGYAEGGFNQDTNTFTVRRRDSHAWPEVYFEGFGWVEFEPTTSQPLKDFPGVVSNDTTLAPVSTPSLPGDGQLGLPRNEDLGNINPIPKSSQDFPAWWLFLPLVLVVGLVAILVWLQNRGSIKILKYPLPVVLERNFKKRGWLVPGWLKQWARLAELSPIERLYTRMSWTLPLIGQKTNPSHTPAERLDCLAKAMPEAKGSILEFLTEYQRAEYSPYPFDIEIARKANAVVWSTAVRTFIRRLRRSSQ